MHNKGEKWDALKPNVINTRTSFSIDPNTIQLMELKEKLEVLALCRAMDQLPSLHPVGGNLPTGTFMWFPKPNECSLRLPHQQ